MSKGFNPPAGAHFFPGYDGTPAFYVVQCSYCGVFIGVAGSGNSPLDECPKHPERQPEPGHHINAAGQFQSDRHPELPPDKIIISFKHPQARRALAVLADDYEATDAELANDIRLRLRTIAGGFDADCVAGEEKGRVSR